MYVTVTSRGRKVRADYSGGPYVELTFGSEGYKPTEVINVWDYQAGKPEAPFDRWDTMLAGTARAAIRAAVIEWIETNESEGWTTWYADYLQNASWTNGDPWPPRNPERSE